MYLSLCLLMLFGCRKDIDEEIKQKDIFEPEVTYFPVLNPVRASVLGKVLDELGNVIPDATINLGNSIAKTDDKGRFYFSKIEMNQSGTYIKAQKSGYFDGSHRFFPEMDSENYVTIRLMEKVETGRFDVSNGGTIIGDGGIEISFPTNSIKYQFGGNLYSGEVVVFARWINPEDETLGEIMPGNLQGINEREEEVALVTYGMMAVELETPNGQPLQLANDGKATLTFPLPMDLVSSAPNEIPLWYFHEKLGLWIEEGSAVLTGNNYVGQVSHFSFWNCDAPFPLIELSGRLITDAGNPMPDAWVYIYSNGNSATGEGAGVRAGQTNSDGYFLGKVPANVDLEITFSKLQGDCVYSIFIEDNYAENTNVGTLEVVQGELFNLAIELKGCSDDPVSGLLEVTVGSRLNTYRGSALGKCGSSCSEEKETKFLILVLDSRSNTLDHYDRTMVCLRAK